MTVPVVIVHYMLCLSLMHISMQLVGFEKEVSHDGQSAHLMWQDGILTALLKQIKTSEEIRAKTLHPDLHNALRPLAVSLTCNLLAQYHRNSMIAVSRRSCKKLVGAGRSIRTTREQTASPSYHG